MFPKKVKNKVIFYCKNCGYEEESKKEVKVKETIKKESDIKIIREEDNMKAFPIVEITCPKCGNDKAYFRIEQTRAGDEAPTRIYKCTKCGYVWREYD